MSYLENYQGFVAKSGEDKAHDLAGALDDLRLSTTELPWLWEGGISSPEEKNELVQALGEMMFRIAHICNLINVSMDRPIIENRDRIIDRENKEALE